jgi:hypothetical protein
MQRRGSTATVSGMVAAAGGSGSFKPGHGKKGSINSLRGIGGHSLFSGHHTNKSSVSQVAPVIAEEPALEHTNGNGDNSSTASSTRYSSVHENGYSEQHPRQPSPNKDADNLSIGDTSSTRSSDHSSILTSDGGNGGRATSVTGVVSGAASALTSTTAHETVDLGPSSPVYKKVAHARTLPHLSLKPTSSFYSDRGNGNGHQQDDRQSQKSGHGFSSLFRHQHKPPGGTAQGMQVVRPPEPRSHVAMLQPLMAKGIHREPLAGITFREDSIMTSDRRGHVKVWKRPPPLPHQVPPPPPPPAHAS